MGRQPVEYFYIHFTIAPYYLNHEFLNITNARCPVCHKKMELRGKGEGQIFVCSCGYKEKLSTFKERRAKEGAGVTKKDVARYLNRQQKEEEPLNNAFAAALAGIRLDPKKTESK